MGRIISISYPTSAGISAGIDLALAILESLKGALFTHKVARGLVVYHRRSGKHKQQSVYLDYRNYINPQVHEVQDYMIDNLSKENCIESLAAHVGMSPRNLSRVFKKPSENPCRTDQSIFCGYTSAIFSAIEHGYSFKNEPCLATKSESLCLAMGFQTVSKEKTGSTVLEYLTMLRKEYASTMLNNPEYTIEYIASKCGFKTARQLQRILKK